MNDTQEPDQCRHEACSCPLPDTGDYCSEYCENAAKGGPAQDCQCEHSGCVE